jgi:hypothetical protein
MCDSMPVSHVTRPEASRRRGASVRPLPRPPPCRRSRPLTGAVGKPRVPEWRAGNRASTDRAGTGWLTDSLRLWPLPAAPGAP